MIRAPSAMDQASPCWTVCTPVGVHVELVRDCRDLPGELDVALGQPVDVARNQAYGHARVPQVDIRVMVRGVGQPADRATSATPAENDLVRKWAHDPSKSARQSETPTASWQLRRDLVGHANTAIAGAAGD